MTTLISKGLVLLNQLDLPEEKLAIITEHMKNYAADTLNVAKLLIEKREDPKTIRQFMEPHGINYDGVKKVFK
ncbi:MAG TPA: hypothetical protein VL832_28105 [Puia sp.]|jgi:hypothetical protein|nr:hypothetical protein [Puia sp.]